MSSTNATVGFAPIKVVGVLDPRVKIDNERNYAVLSGISQVSYRPNISTSYNSSNVTHSAPPPNSGIIVDRRIYRRWFVQFVFTGTGNPLIELGTNDGLRAAPIASCVTTDAVTINNTTVSMNTSDIIQGLLRYQLYGKDADLDYSTFPSMLDQYQEYNDWVTYGSARNPLAMYGENGCQCPRGGFPLNVIANGNGTATIRAEITEPFWLSPMLFNKSRESGFIQVQTFDTNTTFGDLTRMWCHSSGGNTLSNIAVTFYRAPELLFNYITPLERVIPVNDNKPYVYPYMEITRYPTDNAASTAAGASATINSNNIQLGSVPTKMFIFVRQKNSDLTYNSTDSFARIDSISINYQNQSGLLSSATTQDLYLMARKNGLLISWPQFSGIGQYNSNAAGSGVGSVLSIEFGSDIGLDNSAPGMLENAQLQMQVNYTNIGSVTKNYTLYIVINSEGTFTLDGNRAIPQVGVVSKADVMGISRAAVVDYNMVKRHSDWEGGDFWGSFKRVLGNILPYVGPVGNIAKGALGLGVSGGARKRMAKPRANLRLKSSRLMGRGLVTTNELKRKLTDDFDENENSENESDETDEKA